jgi:hypothetical protein
MKLRQLCACSPARAAIGVARAARSLGRIHFIECRQEIGVEGERAEAVLADGEASRVRFWRTTRAFPSRSVVAK